MTTLLRQSTAVDILIGPFVDEDDGKTLEESLTISQGDVMLSKNGQALAQKNDNTACAFDDFGCYNCELDATDTNTVGELVVVVFEDGALPFRAVFQVVEEAIYDALFAASATGALPVSSGGIASTAFASGAITADAIAANAIGSSEIADGAITAAKIATDAIDDDALAADAVTAIQSGLATSSNVTSAETTIIDGILDGVRVSKNTALAGFQFFMVDQADGFTGMTGLTITATRSLDGAAFGACTNAATEIGDGWYTIDLAAGDLNGNTVALNFAATGAITATATIVTQPKD